jgi:hypothetical protein
LRRQTSDINAPFAGATRARAKQIKENGEKREKPPKDTSRSGEDSEAATWVLQRQVTRSFAGTGNTVAVVGHLNDVDPKIATIVSRGSYSSAGVGLFEGDLIVNRVAVNKSTGHTVF